MSIESKNNEVRIVKLEEALRPLVVQWQECVKLRDEELAANSDYEVAEYISIPVQNKAMCQAEELLDLE